MANIMPNHWTEYLRKKKSSPIQCKTGLRIAPASGGKSFGRMDKNFGETLDDAFGAQRTLH